MVRILSFMIAALAIAVLLEPTLAARTDEDPELPPEPSFDDLLAPDNEESKVRPMVYPEAREALEATNVAAEGAARANEATMRARQQASMAESSMSVSKTQAAEAKAAMFQSQQAGLEAKASEVRAHLEQVEAVASSKISAFDKESSSKIAEENRAAGNQVKDIMHKAEVSLHMSKLNTDHGIKESEAGLVRRTKELESEATKKIQEIENDSLSRRDEKIKVIQMRANERVQQANEAAFQRVKRAGEQTERDISTLSSENAAALRSKAEHVVKINNDADVQVKKQADIAEEGLLRVEENKKRVIDKGSQAEELSLKENKDRTDRKVKAVALALFQKVNDANTQVSQINDQASMTITNKNAVTKDKIDKFQDTAEQTIKAEVERYTTDSQQVANLRSNQMKEHEAVLAQATFQEKRVTKQVADRKEEKDSTGKTFQEGAKSAEDAKQAAFQAHSEEIRIQEESKRNTKALQAELATAAALQKARDSAAYAAKAKATADADRLVLTNARTNPLLQSGVPYGGIKSVEVDRFTLSDPAPAAAAY